MAKKKTSAPPSNNSPETSQARERRAPVGARSMSPSMTTTDVPREVAHDIAGPPWPSHDEIAAAAYQRYLDRGGAHGSDVEDWIEAEQALRRRSG
jgi:hypothetical protein